MTYLPNNFCLILAGGVGSKLWPVSRENMPKQFLDFAGTGRSLLQETYDRFAQFILPSNIYVSTLTEYLDIVASQLPQLPRSQILAEPVRRGTLAPVTWATSAINHLCADARIAVTPTDQVIYNDPAFVDDMLRALDFVGSHDGVLSMGVRPTRPETAYGYIQAGDVVDEASNISCVKTFTEKPDTAFAQLFMDSGEFYWNTGLFAFGSHYMLHNIIKHVPEYRDEYPELESGGVSPSTDVVPRNYSALPNLSMEHAVLEHTGHNYVQRCRFGWADLGSWQSISTDVVARITNHQNHLGSRAATDGRNNVTLNSEALFDNASGNIVRLPEGHLAVISGLDNFVVVEEDGVLMVCPKDDAAAMRRLQTLAHLDEYR